MPKHPIVVGDLWRRGDDEIFIVTREKDEDIERLHGEVFYCQNLGSTSGVWFSSGYLNNYLEKIPNFSPTVRI